MRADEPKAPGGAQARSSAAPRLLLVDDDVIDRAAVKRALAGLGAVDEADGVSTAIQALQQRRYDLVLLDYFLPPDTGPEVLLRLRQVRPGLPVVFLSGAGSEEVAATAVKSGGEDYLSKGALGDVPQFQRLVRAAVESGRLRLEVERSQRHLSLAAEAAEMGTWSYDVEPRLFRGDAKFATLVGLPAAPSWPEKELLACLPWEQQPLLTQALAEGTVAHWFGPINGKWLSVRGKAETLGQIFGIAFDVTLQKEAEARTIWMRDQLMGIASHDLRNPLSAVKSAAALLGKSTTLTKNESHLVGIIRTSSERMTNLVVHLLDLTRVRLAGGLSLERRPTALAPIVRNVLTELEVIYPGREVVSRIGEVMAEVDADRVAQVASNLIGNAVKHSDEKSPITVELTEVPGFVSLSVHNFGTPISKEDQAIIFEPFVQLQRKSSRDGLGLGLHISREIVRAHGGTLEVESSAKDGTRFVARFPR